MNMVRRMLKAKNLTNDYQAKVVAWSVYILNGSPTKTITDKIPYEAWNGMKIGVSQLRNFHCVAYAHVP